MNFADLVVVHLAATGFMVGLIWTIHVVHYPLFALVNEPYEPFQTAHMNRITKLLLAPWAAETLTALALAVLASTTTERYLAWTGLALSAVIALLTGLGAAPLHGQILDRFDAEVHRRLMRVDLVRVVLWTSRLAVATLLLTDHVRS